MRTTRTIPAGWLVVGAAVLAAGWAEGAAGQEDQAYIVGTVCADCHPAIQESRLQALNHAASLTCRTCHHLGYSNDPAEVRLRRIDQCQSCHEEVRESHAGAGDRAPECTECHSIHGTAGLTPSQVASARCGVCHSESHPRHAFLSDDAPLCADCHEVHSAAGSEESTSAVANCDACHEGAHPSHAAGGGMFGASPDGSDDAAGGTACTTCHTAEAGFGLAAASVMNSACGECHEEPIEDHSSHSTEEATCTSCHDLRALPAGRLGSARMDRRCGGCHTEELASFESGAHARPGGEVGTPGCTTCHVPGDTLGSDGDAVHRQIEATVLCVECHEAQAKLLPTDSRSRPGGTYQDDFHGATVLFLAQEEGSLVRGEDVLLCSDCHGVHGVELMERSDVAPVCQRCHGDVGAQLAGAWLGHEPPGPRNATVVWLVQIFYTFLIPFMLGGLFLTILFHLVDQRRKGARMASAPGLKRLVSRLRGERAGTVATVTRFTRLERMEHLGSMVTFILLVVTGLPQTRPDLSVAQGIIDLFGGIWSTRIVHRVAGVSFVVLMLTHVVRAVVRSLRTRRLPVMMPARKDFEDIVQTFKHYLARAPLPKVGKFDFSEKFEYWGLFLGGIVMSGSGLVLMFPELFTQILPGILIAALRTMHGLEATFAVLVVVLWHSYGVIFRPEVFPLDTTIFTGRMPVDRLKHEHALEYERLFPDGVQEGPPEGDMA